ncbi:hypothetical protein SEA_ZOOMAN_49 [Microbacterium phage Zooman]|nr:hypothetical protein SEA_ZOOMAN_49 [Microbacterium phage Zooman]
MGAVMEMLLEKGNETPDHVEFVRFTGNYSIDALVRVERWEWESWGKPQTVEVLVRAG